MAKIKPQSQETCQSVVFLWNEGYSIRLPRKWTFNTNMSSGIWREQGKLDLTRIEKRSRRPICMAAQEDIYGGVCSLRRGHLTGPQLATSLTLLPCVSNKAAPYHYASSVILYRRHHAVLQHTFIVLSLIFSPSISKHFRLGLHPCKILFS